MDRSELKGELAHLARKSNEEWLSDLEERKLKELEFHNQDRDRELVETYDRDTFEKLHGNKKFYRTVGLSRKYVADWIARNAPGKVFLDYACGNGLNALEAARAGADLSIGLDISNVSIENARRASREAGLGERTSFLQGDCENTGLPAGSIDLCLCSGMLHHLDLSYALPELRRILRPGGVILAIEALDYNPAIKLYRRLTPQMRTEWEKSHILSYRDLAFASRFFEVRDVRHWHLFSIAASFLPAALPLLNSLDLLALRLPLFQRMSWMFTFELHRRRN